MPRRRRRGRRRTHADKMYNFRIGAFNPAGGRSGFKQFSKTYRAVATARWLTSATTTGDTAAIQINGYNQPLALATNATFSLIGTVGTGQHPSGHKEAMDLGYDIALIKDSYYKFEVSFIGDDAVENVKKDFIFWYKFSQQSDLINAFTVGAGTTDFWADMRVSRGYVWKHFSATHSGGSSWPSQAVVNVKVPSVPKLVRGFNRHLLTAFNSKDMSVAIADGTGSPVVGCFLHFGVFTRHAIALAAGDIAIDATCYQTVKLTKQQTKIDDKDEVDNA